MEPRPTDAYGRSKLDAERGLADVHIDWVAMRPVLVYGPGVKGNMSALVKLAAKSLPLPFGSLPGRREALNDFAHPDCRRVAHCIRALFIRDHHMVWQARTL